MDESPATTRDNRPVAYLVFDVEAVADGELIGRVKYRPESPEDALTAEEAITRYRKELMDKYDSDFMAPTFMLPCAVAVAKVDPEYRLIDIALLDEPHFRPHQITKKFWQGWKHYKQPTLVTFNGRGYDLPVLELAAYRYGLALPEWFNVQARNFEQSRYRYNIDAHVDLMDLLSNFGSSRLTGGLNLLANMIGKPGKTSIEGSQVQDLYAKGEVQEINDYCRSDVLDTYFVFLRTRVLIGRLSLDQEQEIVREAKAWIEERASTSKSYRYYLERWGDWQRPEE